MRANRRAAGECGASRRATARVPVLSTWRRRFRSVEHIVAETLGNTEEILRADNGQLEYISPGEIALRLDSGRYFCTGGWFRAGFSR
jgi:hypothetical protein